MFQKRTHSPIYLILIAISIICLLYTIIYIPINLIIYGTIYWLLLIVTIIAVFIFSFLTFYIILNRFIYDRIKLIYKTISSIRYQKGEKAFEVHLSNDIVSSVNKEVEIWVKNKREEIDNLKRLESYRREFIGNISHELKTPIFNIQGYILTLLDGAIDDKEVNINYLQKTEKNVERLIAIVEDLGIISQLESGEMKLDITKFDIVGLTKEVFEHLETKAHQRNIKLVLNPLLELDKALYVNADKEKIRQVLVNLIENSLKYGTDAGRTKVSFYDMDENILVEVSDNGIGIENDHIPRLFERFYRVDKSRSRNIGGSGLGLSIVKHILESHQQTINVRSLPGVGSTFSFTISKAK